MTIAGHLIGDGRRTFVIAEAGVNHNGCVETALRMVDEAASAGADAVKFQMFRAAELVTGAAPPAAYQRGFGHAESQRAMLAKLELPASSFQTIRKHCDERGILFLATPFGRTELDMLLAVDPPAIKIASTDLVDHQLLRAAAATGLPVILSTGAATEAEIRQAVEWLRELGAGPRLILLHCVSCYPTPIEALNLRAVRTLGRLFGVPVGLSDHTTSVQVGAWAVAAGAGVLEKHFTLDRAACGPDHAMSLEPMALAEYVRNVRALEAALGSGRLGAAEIEADVREAARKSIVSAATIPAGTVLSAEELTLRRPGSGIAPGDWDRVIGRRAAVDIPGDTTLTWDMLK
ncbi:MAG: N-acetylneuraminate synthase family protein [Planctomycetes bacterium]|nr:N-acetylneuraminate synthase family protein [Planctomycetota bacterium]